MIPFLPDIKKKQLQIVILPPLNYLLCCLNWFTRPVKNLPAMQETPSLIPGSGRSTGEGIVYPLQYSWASLVAQPVKQSACNVGDLGSIPGLGRSPGEGKGYPLQYSGLEYSMGSQRVRHTTEQLSLSLHFHRKKKKKNRNKNTGSPGDTVVRNLPAM